ncbi:uncharacterized protein [Pyrus communis]|uniref:uncharacterized protein n=1 Tax=Pyrus communis TaxID=23211 RepID=UPI0035C26F0E
MINAEAELANSLMQYEHHVESRHCGSVTGRSFVQHDREECHDRMMKDYFIERPRFPAHDFWGRFWMRREFFDSILNVVVNHDHYFARKIDVIGRQSLSPHQKFTSAFRMLANGCSADSTADLRRCKEEIILQRQESYRKDMEKEFGILQARWAIVRGPARLWHIEDLHSIMMTCIILHNIIVEDEYIKIKEDSDEDVDDDQPTHARAIARDIEYLTETTYETRQDRISLSEYMRRLNRIQAPQDHDTLRKDLVEHVWCRDGEH